MKDDKYTSTDTITDNAKDKESKQLTSERDNIHKYFMDIAHVVKNRSTCVKRKVGSVIVKDKRIISTGYNNPSVGLPNCTSETCVLNEIGKCALSMHSEQNAIIQASPKDREGATMYVTCQPCANCQLAILNSGITRVVYDERHEPKFNFLKGTHVKIYQLEDIIKKEKIADEVRKTLSEIDLKEGRNHEHKRS